jgi:hypothetical protein
MTALFAFIKKCLLGSLGFPESKASTRHQITWSFLVFISFKVKSKPSNFISSKNQITI